MRVLKAVAQLVAAVLAAIVPAVLVGPMTQAAWINVVILAAGAIMVYNASNIPGWNYAKLVASATSAAAVLLVTVIAGGITPVEIVQLILAAAGAVSVGLAPNAAAREV